MKSSVLASVALSLHTHCKDRLGANYADHEKVSMTKDKLEAAHQVLDSKYPSQVKRPLTWMLHIAVFLGDSPGEDTIAVNKLRSTLKTAAALRFWLGKSSAMRAYGQQSRGSCQLCRCGRNWPTSSRA